MAAYVGVGGAPVSAYQLGLAAGVPLEQLTPTQLAQLQGFQVPGEAMISGIIVRTDQSGNVQLDSSGQPLYLTPSMIAADWTGTKAKLGASYQGLGDALNNLSGNVGNVFNNVGTTINELGTAAGNLNQQPAWLKFVLIGGVAFVALQLVEAVK